VIDECSGGDPTAAEERLTVISELELLDTSAAVDDLADALIAYGAVPTSQPRDAFHIAIAAVNGVQYLVTWNFKISRIQRCKIESYRCVAIADSSRPLFVRLSNYWSLKVMPTPTEEIRKIRRELAAMFDNDVHRIGEETRRRQRESGRRFITLPKRLPHNRDAANQSLHPAGTGGRNSS
jgi:hypothetical protein